MNPEIFAEWLQRQGHSIIRSESSYWYDAGRMILQAFPYHWRIQPSESELQDLMLKHSALALRYSAPLESTVGKVSYHVVLSPPYNMDVLKTSVRNRLKKGLRECQVEKIPFSRLASEGWELQKNTLKRQGRLSSMRQSEWERICLSADGLEDFEAWGAIVNGKLAASIIVNRIDDVYYIPYAQSHSDYFRLYVNNALLYTACHDILARDGISEIFGSLDSLDAPESVSNFKLNMGFTAKPVRQRVVFSPWTAPFAKSMTHKTVTWLRNQKPTNNILAKAEGMLRFYLQGQIPIAKQDWPDCLTPQKQEILSKALQPGN